MISRNSKLNVNGNSLEHLTFVINKLWEYEFAVTLCEQYSCTTWLPSLIITLKKIGNNSSSEETSMHLLVAMQFIANKLRDPEIYYKLELEETSNEIQVRTHMHCFLIISTYLRNLDIKNFLFGGFCYQNYLESEAISILLLVFR